MPKAGPDSRLLENLLRAEKTAQDSFKQWTKDASAASVALSAWAVADSGETPDLMETSMRIGTLLGTCAESQRTYIDALTSYRASLRDVLMRESDIRTILRDREILVSRLITLSKKKTSDAKSESHAARLEDAKRELGACEATLKAEEWGLVGVKRRVLRDAFGMRMRSLGELGVVLEESAKSAIELLDQLGVEKPDGGPAFEDFRMEFANHLAQQEDMPPELDREREGSIAPSQSASQVARRAAGYAASHSDASSEVNVNVPPAHSYGNQAADLMIPSATRRTLATSPPPVVPRALTPPLPSDSSDDEREFKQNLVAHKGGGADLARGKSTKSNKSKISKISRKESDEDSNATATQKPPKMPQSPSRGLWSSFASLFKNRPTPSIAGSDDDAPRGSVLGASTDGKWRTRTDTNLKVAKTTRRKTISGPSLGRRAKSDSSDDEIDPKTLVRVVNNVGMPPRASAGAKHGRRNSIAAEIYNPPLVPSRSTKAMSDIGPPRPQSIMKKTASTTPTPNMSNADLSRSNTVTTMGTAPKKRKKRVISQPPLAAGGTATKTLATNDARWSTGTWVQRQPGAPASPTMLQMMSDSDPKTSRKYTGLTAAGTPAGGAPITANGVAPASSIKKKKKTITSSQSAPALSGPPLTTLTLPTAPPRVGDEGLPVLALPTAPPRISALDLAPSLPPLNGIPSVTPTMLAPPINYDAESTISRRKSVRIADGASTAPVSVRSPSPAPPILRSASPVPKQPVAPPAISKASWSTRTDAEEDVSSDEDDQGAHGFSEYSKAKRAMAKSLDGLSEKAKGKQRAE